MIDMSPPEEIAVGRAVVAVLRLVPRPEQSAENVHVHQLLSVDFFYGRMI